jgi:5'-nucleotidase
MWNRRDFLKRAGAASVLLLLPDWMQELEAARLTRLVILHTNDLHSRIDPFPDNDPRYAGQGGLARIANLVQEVKKREPNVLLLDSGDIFQGTPYFNLFGGKPELEMMSAMGYVATTPGNHDFDNGVEGLAAMLPHATFPYINANYDFSGSALKGKIEPYIVHELNGMRIGIFGIGIALNGLVLPRLSQGITHTDPVEAANRTAQLLRKDKQCNLVICLSHLGYQYSDERIDDRKLAAASEHIDLILGGHTHTFLDTPQMVNNRKGKPVAINQAGWGGLRLGRMEFGLR